MPERKLEPKIDAEIKAETASEQPQPEMEPKIEAAIYSAEDLETSVPKTASQKLKDIDRKTFTFAGYIFWAMILISGGTAVTVILSRKNLDAQTNASQLQNPTESPTLAPSFLGKLSTCSHKNVMEKLRLAFGDENCSRNTELRNTEDCYVVIGENTANLSYEWLDLGDTLIPFSLNASFEEGPRILLSLDLQFSRQGECNLDETDELFDWMQAAKEAAKEAPCSHDEIIWKLKSVFGDENCSRISQANDDSRLQCKLTFRNQRTWKEEAIIEYSWYNDNAGPFNAQAIPHLLMSFYYYPVPADPIYSDHDEQELWFSDSPGGEGPYEDCTFHETDEFFDRVIHAKVKYLST